MPRVPQSQRQVFEKPMGNIRSDVRPSAEAFGAGKVADLHKQALTHAVKGAKKVVNDFDKAEVNKAQRNTQELFDSQYSKFKLEQLQNPTLKRKDFDDRWAKGVDEIKKGLSNAEQRAMYEEVEGRFSTQRKGRFGDHEISEQHKYLVKEDKANIISHKNTASNNYEKIPDALKSIQDIEDSYRDLAKKTGRSKPNKDGEEVLTEDGKIGLSETVSDGHMAVVKRGVNEGQGTKAQAYFDAIKNDKRLTPDAKAKMKKLLTSSNELEQAQSLVDKVMKMKLSKAKSFAYIRAGSGGKVEANAIRDFKVRLEEKDNIVRETKDNIFEINMNEAYKKLKEDKSWKMPQADFLEMDSKQQKSYIAWTDKLRKGETIENDWGVWTQLMKDGGYATTEVSADGTKKEVFIKMSDIKPMNLRMKLDDNHYDRLLRLIQEDKKDKGKASLKRKRIVSVGASIRSFMSAGGIKTIDLTPSSQQRYDKTFSQAVIAVEEEEARLGVKLTNKQIGVIVGGLTNHGITEVKGKLFDQTKPISLMTPNERKRMKASISEVKINNPALYEGAVDSVEKKYRHLTSGEKSAKVEALIRQIMLKQFNKSKQR